MEDGEQGDTHDDPLSRKVPKTLAGVPKSKSAECTAGFGVSISLRALFRSSLFFTESSSVPFIPFFAGVWLPRFRR